MRLTTTPADSLLRFDGNESALSATLDSSNNESQEALAGIDRQRVYQLIETQQTHLYEQYLAVLSRNAGIFGAENDGVASTTTTSASSIPAQELVHKLLRGVCDLADRYRYSQSRWRRAGAFSKITTLLINVQADAPAASLEALCVAVLRAIGALVADNITAKQHVRDLIGYDTLHDAVLLCAVSTVSSSPLRSLTASSSSSSVSLHASTNSSVAATTTTSAGATSSTPSDAALLSSSVLDVLFDLLVDGQFSLAYCIRVANVDALDMMLRLSPRFAISDQQRLYATLLTLLDASPANRSLCCDHHVIFRLLEVSN